MNGMSTTPAYEEGSVTSTGEATVSTPAFEHKNHSRNRRRGFRNNRRIRICKTGRGN
jgi:hypothetical protein